MSEGPFVFLLGCICGTVVFTNFDPPVLASEFEGALKICAEHDGIHSVSTSVFHDAVVGRCKDGLNFDKDVIKRGP